MSTLEKSRKTYEDLVDAIIEALPVRTYTTIEEISRKTGSSWETIWRWLKLIRHIQSQPAVEEMDNPLRTGEMYKRARRKEEH